jgi:predicted peptidase
MGGYGSWFAGAHASDLFAAMAPVCGGGDPEWAKRYAKMPIWTFHGTDDAVVPVARSREMIEALQQAGQEPPPIYTEYEGGLHDVWTETYQRDDLFQWLFSQRRATP